jgi:MFS superfamily sulfate permease-like transporter
MSHAQPLAGATDERRELSRDVMAGVVVFVVALPLCLGIALASGAPLLSGIVAGIVAGLVVGWFSGAQLMVSGPAAGFIAVVAAETRALGSFEAVLVAVILAGLIQIAMGIAQGGFFKSYVPTSVVRGLLSAIGVILVLKQVPHLLGRDVDPEGEMSFLQPDRFNTFSELVQALFTFHPGAAVLGVTSLALLLGWGRFWVTRMTGIPAPLAVVAFGVGITYLFEAIGSPWTIEASHRVQVPVADGVASFLALLPRPDFAQVTNPAVYPAALTIALVGSLQALLTTEAVDRLDRSRRSTPPNRELLAQGVGNCVAGLLGGLPITGEIVRSSVNVDAGARTKLAAIVHGGLLLVAVLVMPDAINRIPLASLAAILIATGSKLASPAVFAEMLRAGRYQFVPYLVTLLAIIFTDPLVGIVIGLLVSVTFILWSNLRRPIRLLREHHLAGNITRIELANQVSFLNRAALRKTLDALPRGTQVLIDGTDTVYIDPDILEMIREFRDSVGPAHGVTVSTAGFRDKYEIDNRIEFVDFTSRELQQDLTPQRAFDYLRAGNERFRTGRQIKRNFGRQVVATAVGQHPVAAVLSCIDSRSPAELLFDLGLGDIFSVRVAGNVATDEVLGSLEFATAVAGAKLIVVLGHTRCGAVGAALQSACRPDVAVAPHCTHLPPIMDRIRGAIDESACLRATDAPADVVRAVADEVAERHVQRVVRVILESSPAIARLVESGSVGIVGMLYDVASGAAWVVPGTASGLTVAGAPVVADTVETG